MENADLKLRYQRFLRGEGRIEDLDRIFLCLRGRAYGFASITEIGDFVAHRDEREKGIVTGRAKDVFLSFENWVRTTLLGEIPTLATAKRVAEANLRVATDEQLFDRLALKRGVTKSVLSQAVKKMERDRFGKVTDREKLVFNYLAGAFIWNPAFTDDTLTDDMIELLTKLKIYSPEHEAAFRLQRPLIALYVLSLIHGSTMVLSKGVKVMLAAGFDNKERRLEVKARLHISGLKKQVATNFCVFWTTLSAQDYCAPELLTEPEVWTGPLEISRDCKLTPLI